MTIRELVTTTINDSAALRELGLPINAIYQADTADNIIGFPFVVLRWMEVTQQLGRASVRPVQAWVYDEQGDFTRAERIGERLLTLVANMEGINTESGFLMATKTVGEGLGRGRDFYDDGYKAIVIPFAFNVVATGV